MLGQLAEPVLTENSNSTPSVNADRLEILSPPWAALAAARAAAPAGGSCASPAAASTPPVCSCEQAARSSGSQLSLGRQGMLARARVGLRQSRLAGSEEIEQEEREAAAAQ